MLRKVSGLEALSSHTKMFFFFFNVKMLSYGSQEAKVYPSGRETKFFFVPS